MPCQFLACLFGLSIIKLRLQIICCREDIGVRRQVFIEGCLCGRRYEGRERGCTSDTKQTGYEQSPVHHSTPLPSIGLVEHQFYVM
jgi:hypothetical protein